MHGIYLFLTFILLFTVAATSLQTVEITDGEQLKEYLCSPKQTIAPNTHLVIVPDEIRVTNLTTTGKKITAGHRPKTDQKAGMAVYLLNSPDIKPTSSSQRAVTLQSIMSMRNYVDF